MFCSVEFPKSLSGGVGTYFSSDFIYKSVYSQDPTFQAVTSYCFILVSHNPWTVWSYLVTLLSWYVSFCLHETCTVQKHWNHTTKYVETQCVRRIVSEIHLLVCRLKIAAISCSSTCVLLCTWDIIYSVATGLAPKARTTSKPFLYTTS